MDWFGGGQLKHYVFENAAVQLAGIDATREFLEPMFAHRDREVLVVGMCDDNLRLVRLLSFLGTEDEIKVPVPRIMRQAVASGCTGVVFAHNHPSGELRPSPTDLRFTKRISIAAESVGITILDHLIFNCGPAFSFRRQGLL
jgi:DNA repair protein RadC